MCTLLLGVHVKVVERCAVTGIETYTDDYGAKRLRSVQTDRGTIKSNTVVNCAGLYISSFTGFSLSAV